MPENSNTTTFDAYDVRQLAACAKKNNVDITITWYEDRQFVTIHPIGGMTEPSEARKLEEVISSYKTYRASSETDDEATMKRIISEICSIEFDSEAGANALLLSLHYTLGVDGIVTSNDIYEWLDCTAVNYDFKVDDEDKDDTYIVWKRKDCGMDCDDFLEVKIIKKANGKYSYDSSTFPKPSYCVYNYSN